MRRKLSLGEIAAAWICCAILALGAFLINSGERDGPAAVAYAGAHIPGGGGQRLREPDSDQDPADEPGSETGAQPSQPVIADTSSAQILAIGEPGRESNRAARYCRYAFLYSATAKLAGAGAGSGVREAAQ